MNVVRTFSVRQVAAILQISPKTMYQIVKEGQIDVIWVRGQIRITSAALQCYLDGGSDERKEDGTKEGGKNFKLPLMYIYV